MLLVLLILLTRFLGLLRWSMGSTSWSSFFLAQVHWFKCRVTIVTAVWSRRRYRKWHGCCSSGTQLPLNLREIIKFNLNKLNWNSSTNIVLSTYILHSYKGLCRRHHASHEILVGLLPFFGSMILLGSMLSNHLTPHAQNIFLTWRPIFHFFFLIEKVLLIKCAFFPKCAFRQQLFWTVLDHVEKWNDRFSVRKKLTSTWLTCMLLECYSICISDWWLAYFVVI